MDFDWVKVSEQLPTKEPFKQVLVLFGQWRRPIPVLGLFTYFGPGREESEYRWSIYDQLNDRFVECKIKPDVWMFCPEIPKGKEENGSRVSDSEN